MTTAPFSPPPAGCDAVQAQLSDLADSGAPLLPELRAHLDACPACARFAEFWLHSLPSELTPPPVQDLAGTRLRESILDAAPLPNVVPFPAPALRRPPLTIWLGRIAAGLAVASLAYWLLDPVRSPGTHRPALAADPTLSQAFLRTEGRSKREQQALQSALLDGGRQVHGNVAWAVSALEL